MSTSHDDDPRVLELLASALEIQARGEAVDLERHCAEHPELQTQVAAALGLAEHLPVLQRAHRAQGADTFAGRVLAGRYRLEERLGAGAMGVVYRGLDLELRRPVAVKLLRSDLWGGEEALARFAREAEALAAIRHPAVVTVHDRGRSAEDELEFLVMELLEGASLGEIVNAARAQDEAAGGSARSSDLAWVRELLGAESLPEQTWVRLVVRWCAELAAGLRAAHEAGVLHRDLKPSNVFIRRDGRPVLLDFGIAALSGGETVAQRSSALGTPAYMAPEQLAAEQRVTTAADVYGLTATLYAALTNRPPYAGSLSQVLSAMQRREPTPAYKLRPGLPRDLQAILDCGMARQPENRYAEASGLEADLRAFLDYRPVAARPVTVVGRFWRRAWAAREVKAGAVILTLLALSSAVVAWDGHRRAIRLDEYSSLRASWPPGVSLSRNLSARVISVEGERARLRSQLDRLCSLADHALPAHLMRASFHLDHGDSAAALRDMEIIANQVATPYARALGDRYRELPRDAQGSSSLRLEGLPEHSTYEDRFLASYHLMRKRKNLSDIEEAVRLAHTSAASEVAIGGEFELLFLLELARSAALDERPKRYAVVHELALRHESQLGRASATTTFVRGTALAGLTRNEEALACFRNAVEICPENPQLRVNLAYALREVGDFRSAIREAQAGALLRPDLLQPRETWILALLDIDEFDQARAVAEEAPYPQTPTGDGQRSRMLGLIDLERAKRALASGSMEEARELASKSYEALVRAQEAGEAPPAFEAQLCEALLLDDPREGFAPLVEVLMDRAPLNWTWLEDVITLWPDDLDAEQSRLVRGYLRVLAGQFTPWRSRE